MSVEIHIVDGPLGLDASAPGEGRDGAGAVIVFDGIVRGREEGRPLAALTYEAYEPMASRELAKLGDDIARKHGLLGLRCVHSRGRVGVGECSMRVTIWSAHRAEGLAAMGEFIDRLKQDVPIWKRVVWKE